MIVRTQEAILDGELLVWDELGETLLPFGAARSVANDTENAHLFYVIFDILRVKTSKVFDLTTQPYSKRRYDNPFIRTRFPRDVLKKVLPKPVPTYLEIIASEIVLNQDQITAALAK